MIGAPADAAADADTIAMNEGSILGYFGDPPSFPARQRARTKRRRAGETDKEALESSSRSD